MNTHELTQPQDGPDMIPWEDYQGVDSLEYLNEEKDEFDFLSESRSIDNTMEQSYEDPYEQLMESVAEFAVNPFSKDLGETTLNSPVDGSGDPSVNDFLDQVSGKTQVYPYDAKGSNPSSRIISNPAPFISNPQKKVTTGNDLSSSRKSSSVTKKSSSKYSRQSRTDYNYEPLDNRLFTEIDPTQDFSWLTEDGMETLTPESQSNIPPSLFERLPLTDFYRVINYEDLYDLDEYLKLAERPHLIRWELIANKNNPPKYCGYDYPREPVEFIGKLTEIRNAHFKKGKGRKYCFTTLGLDKIWLAAFPTDTGGYKPSYSTFDVAKIEIGTYWYCKVVLSVKTQIPTWAEVKEVKAPGLRDIFQNPDPKFRPKGWSILNNKIIFDTKLIEDKPNVGLPEFRINVENGKTNKYSASVEGMLC